MTLFLQALFFPDSIFVSVTVFVSVSISVVNKRRQVKDLGSVACLGFLDSVDYLLDYLEFVSRSGAGEDVVKGAVLVDFMLKASVFVAHDRRKRVAFVVKYD